MKRFVLGFGLLAASIGLGGAAVAQGPAPEIREVSLSGVVDPFSASYIDGAIEAANDDGVAAVVLLIDTPGGLDSSMRDIVKAVSNSRVPVLCYTAPAGARAASAGTFIMLGCPVAAMAPGTNIGAAHPVGIAGAIPQEKVTNDAAAFIRALAERWGRNADWAEEAVRDSVSVSSEEALRLGVVDVLSSTRAQLVHTAGACAGPRASAETGLLADRGAIPGVCGATVVIDRMGLGPSIFHRLLDPNLAFIFFYLGIALIVAEFFVPGGVVGTVGVLMLIASVVALGMLPVQLLGMVLLVASVAFFILELKLPGTWIGTGAGLVTLVLGALFLFDRSVPGAAVSPWVIGPVAIAATMFFAFVLRAAIRMRRQPAVSDTRVAPGAVGVVLRDLDPTGVVLLAAEEWTAWTEGEPIPRGARVRVEQVHGLRLSVVPVEEPAVDVTTGPGGGSSSPAASRSAKGGLK
ncbi:MAG: nodulation protein NfeD [Actinomycetota bacterium]